MDEATSIALAALAAAVAARDLAKAATLAAALTRQTPSGLPVEVGDEVQRALAGVLSEAGAAEAAADAHARALEMMARGTPDPWLVLQEIDALITLALARSDHALAARLQEIAAELTRTVDGDDSPALAARLADLERLRARMTPRPMAAQPPQQKPAPVARPDAVPQPVPDLGRSGSTAVGRALESVAGAARERAAPAPPPVATAPAGLEAAEAAASVEPAPDYQKVDVFFATSRAPTGSDNPYRHFSGQRNDGPSGPVHSYGIAEVSIPQRRTVGSLPTAGWLDRHPGFHSDELYLLKKIRALSDADWQKEISGRIAARSKREALIYIHGFNVAFWEAMVRAAQLHTDLDIDGVVAAYSWPSRSNIFYYLSDRQEIIAPHVDELKRMIATIARVGDVGRVTVVAHSMGCEFLLPALEKLQLELAAAGDRKLPLLKDVIFAAPDVDVAHFATVVPKLSPITGRISVYTSEKDQALSWGRWLMTTHDRAGNQPAKLALALAGKTANVDTIDTTEAAADMIAHTDFSTSAIDDLRAVVWLSLMPERRPTLIQRWAPNGGPAYWVYRSAAADRDNYRQALQLARRHGGVSQALAALKGGASMLAELPTGEALVSRPDDLMRALQGLA